MICFFRMPNWTQGATRYPSSNWHSIMRFATNDDYATRPVQFRRQFGTGRDGKKSEESAKVPRGRHKCPNYLAAGIRSTVIIWTGQRNLGGRRNLRDGRGPPSPLLNARSATMSEFAFQHTKPSPLLPPSLQHRPHVSCFRRNDQPSRCSEKF